MAGRSIVCVILNNINQSTRLRQKSGCGARPTREFSRTQIEAEDVRSSSTASHCWVDLPLIFNSSEINLSRQNKLSSVKKSLVFIVGRVGHGRGTVVCGQTYHRLARAQLERVSKHHKHWPAVPCHLLREDGEAGFHGLHSIDRSRPSNHRRGVLVRLSAV